SEPVGPFPNLSSFQLGEWYLNAGSNLSLQSLKELVKIAQNPGFAEDISEVNWRKALNALSAANEEITVDSDAPWVDEDGWKETPIHIAIPLKGGMKEDVAAGVLHHRSIVSIVRDKIANTTKDTFHYEPFELSWQPDSATPATRVRSELYNSDAFIKAHKDLQNSPPIPGCNRERVIVGLMFWSDETQLTNFSSEGMWPCYMQFANESKYERCKPTSGLAHLIAFFDKLSDDFRNYLEANLDQTNEDAFRSYCKQGLFQGQWAIMLDGELLEAMENGLVVECPDLIERRFYIRPFTYSADYMEKVLIATLRKYPSKHPCTRCLVEKGKLDQMGTPKDMSIREQTNREDNEQRRSLIKEAQKLVFEDDVPFGDSKIDALLKGQSYHPVTNAFSALAKFGFNIFTSLTVDLLHEYEIGVWKAVFIHLLRILSAKGDHADSLTHSLNRRYRLVPAFGRSIRKFSQKHNVSEMKKKAARDFEDMLQCAIPVFDGLLPDSVQDKAVLSVLSACAEWHALAKLRMHTDNTLDLLERATQDLANELRSFISNVCSKIQTEELAAETEARERREARKAEKEEIKRQERALKKRKKPKLVKLNICTPKFHFLGDYVKYIRLFGTTDNYSTQLGELLHRHPKKWYKRGQKRNARRDVGRYERKKEGAMNAEVHHFIGESQTFPVKLSAFDLHRASDSAYTPESSSETFLSSLREDLLPRVVQNVMAKQKELAEQEGFSCEPYPAESYEPSAIVFKDRRIYAHRIIRIKYTTYDVRRHEDVVHVDSDVCNVMLPNQAFLKDPKAPPYKYGRVLGIYHAHVSYTGEIAPGGVRYLKPMKIEFLLVRWYDHIPSDEGAQVAMDRLRLPAITSPDATQFIDPSTVLRAAHVIPRFSLGPEYGEGRGISEMGRDSSDWKEYFVNRYADRDMYMRYRIGFAPGHTGIWPSQLALRELRSWRASRRRRAKERASQQQSHREGDGKEDGGNHAEDNEGDGKEGGENVEEDEDGEESNSDTDSDDSSDSDDEDNMDIDEEGHDEEMYGYESS
ncbi:hypothetical protein FA13DRAFT_1654889, partial [Coprinellus micaceus]